MRDARMLPSPGSELDSLILELVRIEITVNIAIIIMRNLQVLATRVRYIR